MIRVSPSNYIDSRFRTIYKDTWARGLFNSFLIASYHPMRPRNFMFTAESKFMRLYYKSDIELYVFNYLFEVKL